VLVRLLELGEAFSKSDQVAIGSRGAGVRDTEDAAKAPNRVLKKFLGKYQFVSRGSSALHDRPRVTVGQSEVYIVVGAERASRRRKQWARERHRLTGLACETQSSARA
jgi:hypothetical protein